MLLYRQWCRQDLVQGGTRN